jgi:hypothetical protein
MTSHQRPQSFPFILASFRNLCKLVYPEGDEVEPFQNSDANGGIICELLWTIISIISSGER